MMMLLAVQNKGGCGCVRVVDECSYSAIITLGMVSCGLFWFLHVVLGSVRSGVCGAFHHALMGSC